MQDKKTNVNNSRIAKNTLLLYIRMFFIMATQLYTSRVVLNTLGIEDYGIYNVVGGVIAMFGFLNTAMSTSTQRYLTFQLGKKNIEKVKKVFSTSLYIHFLIAFIVLILGETIGLWFLYNKMVIPVARMQSALWVYQCSVLATMVLIVSVPYNAVLIAHEKMSAFAYISILEVLLKLFIVYLLVISPYDKLKLYAVLILVVQLFIRYIYGIYCSKHFEESKFQKAIDKPLFKEMLGFAAWNLWGNCAAILFTTGINLLLNVFFGPAVNAARAIAVQVQSAIQQFSGNFQMALNPQITKTYAQGELKEMHKLVYRSSKFTFLLLFVLSLPIMAEAPIILKIWLKLVPDHTVIFLRLILLTVIVDSMAQPLMQAAASTGKVKRYQSIVGGVLLLIVPLAYVVLKLGAPPESVFIVHFAICCIAFLIRLYIIRPLIQLNILDFLRRIVFKSFVVVLICSPTIIFLKHFFVDSILSMFLICITSVVLVSVSGYLILLDSHERKFLTNKVYNFIHKII